MNFDVVLLAPPSRSDNHYRPPLSLMYVAGYYKSKGLSVKILDYPFKKIMKTPNFLKYKQDNIGRITKNFIGDIVRIQPKIVGISCYSTEIDEVKQLIEKIKKYCYVQPKIVVGGIHPTLKPEDFENIADYCIQGRLDDGLPDYSLVDMGFYTLPNPYAIRGVFLACAYILSSFGCPSQCTFCVAPSLMRYYKKVQFKAPIALYDEIKHLKDTYHIDGFYLIDDLYTTDKKKVIEFCSLIKKEKMLWACSSKVTTIDEEIIKAMSRSGCVQIDFGIERGSDEALKKVKKGITIEKIKNACALCRRYKIRVFANFIVGLPEETEKDRKDIESLINETQPQIVSINHFSPYYGTELHKQGCIQDTSPEVKKFILRAMKKYNSVWTNLMFALSFRYLSTILRSKRKSDYWRQLWYLLKEIGNQKLA